MDTTIHGIVDEKYLVQWGMEVYGGGFVKALGQALRHADANNTQRIKTGFPDYWKQYLEIGQKLKEKQEGGN